MRIEAYTQVQQAYKTKNTSKNQGTSATSFADQIQISSLGKDFQTAKQAVANSPDVREEIMAPIKASIQGGTYNVSSQSFAEKVIEKYNEMR
ncbi:MAG TPA: flagellar biosynthesis anti-sigma factor FlgM [Lachnospiraceae bacterium]|nr:flagellar biosynthesis anti-sigma factor FlgM [Lachnospiraceae bacterium]